MLVSGRSFPLSPPPSDDEFDVDGTYSDLDSDTDFNANEEYQLNIIHRTPAAAASALKAVSSHDITTTMSLVKAIVDHCYTIETSNSAEAVRCLLDLATNPLALNGPEQVSQYLEGLQQLYPLGGDDVVADNKLSNHDKGLKAANLVSLMIADLGEVRSELAQITGPGLPPGLNTHNLGSAVIGLLESTIDPNMINEMATRIRGWIDVGTADNSEDILRRTIVVAGLHRFVRWSTNLADIARPHFAKVKTETMVLPIDEVTGSFEGAVLWRMVELEDHDLAQAQAGWRVEGCNPSRWSYQHTSDGLPIKDYVRDRFVTDEFVAAVKTALHQILQKHADAIVASSICDFAIRKFNGVVSELNGLVDRINNSPRS